MKMHQIGKQTVMLFPIRTSGFILDIGGGGEGIIGKLGGRQVVAIDNRVKELHEVKNVSQKIAMDARKLGFNTSSFDTVTAFFSLMYIMNKDHEMVFKNIHKVLRDNGRFLLWDVRIPPKTVDADAFVVPLEVILPDCHVETSYGVKWDNQKKQDLSYLKSLANRTDFRLEDRWQDREVLYLEPRKDSGE